MEEMEEEAAGPALEALGVQADDTALNYVANSYIYPEAPNQMVVTCRGVGGRMPPLWKVSDRQCMNHSVTLKSVRQTYTTRVDSANFLSHGPSR
jgi:hypothetical protein